MNTLKIITLQLILGFTFALIVYKLGFHGYYAGYVVGMVVMLIGVLLASSQSN